jgi:hypothetical protein
VKVLNRWFNDACAFRNPSSRNYHERRENEGEARTYPGGCNYDGRALWRKAKLLAGGMMEKRLDHILEVTSTMVERYGKLYQAKTRG